MGRPLTKSEHQKKLQTKAEKNVAWREKMKQEKPVEWKRMCDERTKKAKERRVAQREAKKIEDDKKVQQTNVIYVKHHREKKRQAKSPTPPSTPNTRAEAIVKLIETATPRTAASLEKSNIKKSRERQAEADIVKAASASVKNKLVRRKLVTELRTCNKKATSGILGISRSHFYNKSQKGLKPRISPATRQQIQDFYLSEELCTTYPNKQKNGSVLKILKYSLRKCYDMLRATRPHLPIKKTTFCKLRPKSVKLMKSARYVQCLCDVCDNVDMICQAIATSMQRNSHDVPDVMKDRALLTKSTLCNARRFDCIDRKCNACGTSKIQPFLSQWLHDDDNLKISYTQWQRTTDEVINGKRVNKTKKVSLEATRAEIYVKLCDLVRPYAYHYYNMVNQLAMFSKVKKSLGNNQAVCVVDYAENYVCREWSEAHSCYYTRDSVTVHPMVLIFAEDSAVRRDSVIMMSDDLKHDADAVYMFMGKLGAHVEKYYPRIDELIVFSDGCGCQYKSRKPMYHLSKNFDISQKVTWNFYGSRHGKGEADGESAVVKGYLTRSIKAQRLSIRNANECYQFLTSADFEVLSGASRRHVYMIPKVEIDMKRDMEEDVVALPGVKAIHQVTFSGTTTLTHRRSTCYCAAGECTHDPSLQWKTFYFPTTEREKQMLIGVLGDAEDDMDMNEEAEVVSEDESEDEVENDGNHELVDGLTYLYSEPEDIDEEMHGASKSSSVKAGPEVSEVIRANPDLFDAELDDEEEEGVWEEVTLRREDDEAFWQEFETEWDGM